MGYLLVNPSAPHSGNGDGGGGEARTTSTPGGVEAGRRGARRVSRSGAGGSGGEELPAMDDAATGRWR